MNSIRKAVSAIGGIALAALLIAALVPKATHGLVAALVQVANTTANPAITSNMDDPGRIAYQAQIIGTTTANCFPGGCAFTFAPVPAGHRLVIQHVSMFILANANSVPARVLVQAGIGVTAAAEFLVTNQDTRSSLHEIQFDQSVLLYVDAGVSPFVTIGASIDTTDVDNGQIATLFGYMLDCNAAPCSPIIVN
jgi:hypothetical protein